MDSLARKKDALETEMSAPHFFDAANSARSAAAGRELAALNDAIEAAEETWLELQEQLSAALGE